MGADPGISILFLSSFISLFSFSIVLTVSVILDPETTRHGLASTFVATTLGGIGSAIELTLNSAGLLSLDGDGR